MNKKNNKQFQGSAMRMEKAMLELINTTLFEKITVRLICERAGVNRSTFYAHYTDIYDMIGQLEANLKKELVSDYPASGNVVPLSLESFIPFLKFVCKHRDFYQIILRTKRELPLQHWFEPLWNQTILPLCAKAGITSENEMLFYFAGFQAGFTMILKRWLEQGCTESVEDMAKIIRNIIPSVWKIT